LSILKSWLKPVDMADDYNALRLKHQEGTREWLLTEVDHWIHQDDRRALWLKGVAGMGKSVMGALLFQKNCERGKLGGYFFCKHDNQDQNNPRQLINTLAFELARSNKTVQKYLIDLHQSTPEIIEKSVTTCFCNLILEPLQQASVGHPFILVIDAL